MCLQVTLVVPLPLTCGHRSAWAGSEPAEASGPSGWSWRPCGPCRTRGGRGSAQDGHSWPWFQPSAFTRPHESGPRKQPTWCSSKGRKVPRTSKTPLHGADAGKRRAGHRLHSERPQRMSVRDWENLRSAGTSAPSRAARSPHTMLGRKIVIHTRRHTACPAEPVASMPMVEELEVSASRKWRKRPNSRSDS